MYVSVGKKPLGAVLPKMLLEGWNSCCNTPDSYFDLHAEKSRDMYMSIEAKPCKCLYVPKTSISQSCIKGRGQY